ncbi:MULTISPECIES: AI-2E family transporter [unclassified Streptomyces]|uniref:AI-2E family transporter n=1 Tax=unclassified Streptomyces TaxID=2593676 RepID=UPI002DDA5E6C|nr:MULTISPECIES: AI-2E family transporter [unclassified Streptomyces]WSA92003.1 AI-2E family transporter [Streptomyces sp. NBC_01795]WSB76370.1 AI-2E family transporter [Streptomyces sp. NBC_01775]WSS15355.1 AI-2E family transporter [Streptomyces sp. NBC_01186]WSS44200.1 AI-2E family transporter [Streptomyces sp. NBC_01187]
MGAPDDGGRDDQGEGPGREEAGHGGRGEAPSGSTVRDTPRMPRWLPRALVLALALVGAYQLLGWAVLRALGLLLNILVAFFLALAMEPAVDGLARRGMRRGLATGVVFLAVLIAGAGFFTALGSLFADQITKIVDNLPAYVSDVIDWINATFHTHLDADKLQSDVIHSDWVRGSLRSGAQNVWGISATVLGGVFQLLTVVLFTFYFAAEGPRLRVALCSVLPPAHQAEALRAWEIAVAKTGGYIYSRALMALVSGVAHYVFLQLLGVPYAAALAVWVGVLSQFVPTVGTYLAGALPMLLAFTVDPWSALWVLAFVVVYQQFENYVIQPRITAKTVDIHPAVAFGSVIAGTSLMGVAGALIAIPVTATLQGFLGAYVRRYDVTDVRVRLGSRDEKGPQRRGRRRS